MNFGESCFQATVRTEVKGTINGALRPDVELTVVAESVERMRQPQWAQKLWCKSRSLVRPQLAQRATGFVLARKSVRHGHIRETVQ